MPRIELLQTAQSKSQAQDHLSNIESAFGMIPNMFRAVAHSPSALKSMWSSFGALGEGTIDPKLGEQIAVAIANINSCEYCLAAHTALGRKAGASMAEMESAQQGNSTDPRTAAILSFACSIVKNRGQVATHEIDRLRQLHVSDELIVEVVAHVALNTFTNYINLVFEVPIDFPRVQLRK
jgi:uncharacterized peroxidase-related enzyme